MKAVWELLLPAMASDPVEPHSPTVQALARKLKDLKLTPVNGKSRSPVSKRLLQQKFQVLENEAGVHSVSFDLHGDDHRITVNMEHGIETLHMGNQKYVRSEMKKDLPYTQNMSRKIGASGGWVKPDEYLVKVYLTESPASIFYRFQFKDHRMTWTSELRHSLFGPRELPILRGE